MHLVAPGASHCLIPKHQLFVQTPVPPGDAAGNVTLGGFNSQYFDSKVALSASREVKADEKMEMIAIYDLCFLPMHHTLRPQNDNFALGPMY